MSKYTEKAEICFMWINENYVTKTKKCDNCGLLQVFWAKYRYQCNCEKMKEWRTPI